MPHILTVVASAIYKYKNNLYMTNEFFFKQFKKNAGKEKLNVDAFFQLVADIEHNVLNEYPNHISILLKLDKKGKILYYFRTMFNLCYFF
jgi:hypothetical protein